MDNDTLLKWLNWFYTLEIGQVDLYLNQAKETKDEYIAHVLLKVAEIEARHARVFREIIYKLGRKPLKIDALLSYITGFIPGKITPLFGTVNSFYYNYILETIAMADYKLLIKRVEPVSPLRRDLLEILMNNLVEEDLHRVWFKDRRESLKRMEE